MSNEMDFPFWSKLISMLSSIANKRYVWWFVLGLLFLPLGLLAWYNHPAADDYFYAADAMKRGFWGAQQNSYTTWSGRYFSTLCLTGNPILWASFTGYRLLNVLLLAGTAFSCLFFVKTVLNKKSMELTTVAVAVCFLFLFLSKMPILSEGFYWLAGAMTYQLPNISILIVISLLFKMQQAYSIKKLIAVAALCITICGGNETIMLELIYILVAMMLYEYATVREVPKYYYIVLLVSVLAAAVVLLAPGNAVRASFFQGEKNIVKALWLSGQSSFFRMVDWLPAILILLVLFLPFIKQLEVDHSDRRQITPGLLILYPLFIIGILIVGLVPAYWSMGSEAPARTLNVLYWLFIASCLHYVILWVVYTKQKNGTWSAIPIYIQLIFLFILLINVVPLNNLRTAYMDLISGRAMAYDRQQHQRYFAIQNSTVPNVLIPPITVKPKSIFLGDIEAGHPEDWKNVCMAEYFKVKSLDLSKPME